MLLPLLLLPAVLAVPLQPGQPGGAWTEEEVEVAQAKVRAMIACGGSDQSGGRGSDQSCWLDHPLASQLAEGELDDYSRPHEEDTSGPRIPVSKGHRGEYSRWSNDRRPTVAKLVQLGFHDCLKYESGGGGCDGCINWSGVGFKPRNGIRAQPSWGKTWKQFPILNKTDNNKLQMTVRSLELIFTETDWPETEASLPISLKEAGKSRADLWQLAANTALGIAVTEANAACDNPEHKQQHVVATEGRGRCDVKLHRPLPFLWGRVDCQPDPAKKWTPFPFEATEEERHSNPRGTGDKVLRDVKEDFGLTAKETIALMAAHGLPAQRHNYVLSTKYVWFGSASSDAGRNSNIGASSGFSNIYFKYLNGNMYKRGGDGIGTKLDRGYWVGDRLGRPVGGTGWSLHCHGQWNTSTPEAGPCDFRPTHGGCRQSDDPDQNMRNDCFDLVEGSWQRKSRAGCQDAELDPLTLVQTGGDAAPWQDLCKNDGWTFGMPYEVSFAVNFTVDGENRPRGCGALDGTPLEFGYEDTSLPQGEKYAIYAGSPGFDGSPGCGANMNAPEGEASSAIVAAFADNHDLWAETFLEAWVKMQTNGYSLDQLSPGPPNSWLLNWLTPLAPDLADSSVGCSEDGSVLDPNKFYLQNVRNSRVMAMSPDDEDVQMATLVEGDSNQLWQRGLLCSGMFQLYNVGTGQGLGSWTYDPAKKLLQNGDGRWARTTRRGFKMVGRVRWIMDAERRDTDQPWSVFQWDVVRA